MSKLTDRTVFQNAWVVTDVFEAAKKWVEFYGVGPFYVMEHLDLADIKYRGEPGKLDISVALAQAGPVQIELIQQFNPDNTAYRDMYKEGESGFHHVCIWSHDFEADKKTFEEAGYPTAMEGMAPDRSLSFAYFDTRKDFDIMMEVVTPTDGFIARNEMIKQHAADWDGKDPIRMFTADGGYITP